MAETIVFGASPLKVASAARHRASIPVTYAGDTANINGQGSLSIPPTVVDYYGYGEPIDLYSYAFASSSAAAPIVYTITQLDPARTYDVKLHYATQDPSAYVFTQVVDGATTSTESQDIVDSAGAVGRALRVTKRLAPTAQGVITITLTPTQGHAACICGFEVWPVPSGTAPFAPFADNNSPTTSPASPFAVDNNSPTTSPIQPY